MDWKQILILLVMLRILLEKKNESQTLHFQLCILQNKEHSFLLIFDHHL